MFMFRKILVSVLLGGVALGQQTAADPGEAEKALRRRVQEFYQLQVEKKFRQAEAYVAADTKDFFYATGKPDLASFSIEKVVMESNGTRAEVTVKGKVSMFVMGSGMVPIDLPTTGSWKIEEGQWVWYVDRTAVGKTPFGEIKPAAGAQEQPASAADIAAKIKSFDVASIRGGVTLDRSTVDLNADQPVQEATISNGMPGAVELKLLVNPVKGLAIELDKTHLNAGEKAKVVFTRKAEGTASGVAKVLVSPLELMLEIHFSSR